MTAAPDLFGATAPAPAPISAGSPTIIKAAVERERHALAARGLSPAEVERGAVAIVRAKLGNAVEFAPVQASVARCHACDAPLDDSRPVVAVLTAKPRNVVWLHGGACHDIHARRHAARIDGLMAAAGFAPAPIGSPSHQKDPHP